MSSPRAADIQSRRLTLRYLAAHLRHLTFSYRSLVQPSKRWPQVIARDLQFLLVSGFFHDEPF